MPRPEKIVVRSAGLLFVLAAALEGISRLGGRPAFHEAAAWTLVAGLFAVLAPIAVAALFIGCQTLVARWKRRDSGARNVDKGG